MSYRRFNPNIESIHFHCTADLKEQLSESAEANGLTVSSFLRMLIMDWYREQEPQVKPARHG